MKKFSKILFLLLALVAIVTAFTVVALAAEEATEKAEPVVLEFSDTATGEKTSNLNFEQTVISEGEDSKVLIDEKAKWSVYEDETIKGTNKYLVSEYSGASGNGTLAILFTTTYSINGYFGKDTVDTSGYGVDNYPTFAFDFDVMSPTGSYAGSDANNNPTLYFRIYNNKSRVADTPAKDFTTLGLSGVPYEWQHVTVVVSHNEGAFTVSYYKNGEFLSVDEPNNYSTTLNGATSKVRVYGVYMAGLRDSSKTNKLCMDNLQFSYYPTGYTADEIGNYVYDSGNYELPAARVVASVIENEVETKYASFEEAYAAANENNVLKLYADTTCTIDKPMTVHSNGYTFTWTSQIYTDVNSDETVYQFQKKPPVVLQYTDLTTQSTSGVVDFEDFTIPETGYYELQNSTGYGRFDVYPADNGNKYLVNSYESGTNQEFLDLNLDNLSALNKGTNDTKPYGVDEYPVFAFDFDIMSPTGSYASTTGWNAYVAARIYNNNGTPGFVEHKNIKDLGLSSVPYEWQHVTLVVTYIGNGTFASQYFVNGVEAPGSYQEKDYSTKLNGAESKVRVRIIRIAALTDNKNKNHLCMDNFQFSYYPIGYTADDAAKYVYNGSYELPYGKTVASIVDSNENETPYDNFAEAYAAANRNNTLKLYADATCKINKAVNVDANEYTFTWTGDNFVDVDANADDYVYKLRTAGEAYLSDVEFNLSYYSSFKYNLYLPVNDVLTINSVSWEGGTEVYIRENKYYVYSLDVTTTGACAPEEVTVNYTVNEKAYSQTYKVSAFVYAEIALATSENELEKHAVSNMARYIIEAKKEANEAIEENDYTNSLTAFVTDYDSVYEDLGADYDGLTDVGIGLALNGGTVAYYVEFSDATDVTASIGGKSIDVELIDGRWYTKAARVYDIVLNTIEITVTKADGSSLTGTYSVGAYINGSANDLAKAMYEFGEAAALYRNYLLEN